MKELSGTSSGLVAASADECVHFLRAVERYPTWHPEVVRTVEVVERDGDGEATRARALLHVAVGPFVKDFNLMLEIALPEPRTVTLKRVPHGPDDEERFEVIWTLEEGTETRIRLDVHASLSVPRFVPVGGIGDGLAQGFVSAATKALAT